MKIKEWAKSQGYGDLRIRDIINAALEEAISSGTCPALCSRGCIVEPDGVCQHDEPSILLALDLI